MSKSAAKPYTLYDPSKPLSSVYQKRAAKELGESPEQISAHLESFKRWLKSMPHLKVNADDTFLLAFLRQAKYNHMKAQNRLDNFCTFRTSSDEGCPAWFDNVKEMKANFDKWVDMKCWAPLGFTQDGTLTVLINLAKLDLSHMSMTDLHRSAQIWQDQCVMDQRSQIGGFAMIMDLTGATKDDIFKLFDPKLSRLSAKYFQECLPFRIKKLIYYNAPKVFETMFKVFSEWLNEKMKSRVLMVGGNMNAAFDAVPGLKDIMPESYGGNVKQSFDEICENLADTLKTIPEYETKWAISVDESKRPKESKNLFGHYKDLTDDLMGKAGTYVKLNDEL